MYTTSKPWQEFICPFELFKDMVKTKSDDPKFKNHALLRRDTAYNFMEFSYDFVEKALDSLKTKTNLVAAGIDEFTPSDLLLFEFLKEYGFESAVKTVSKNTTP
jgi:hypothetical protein